MTKPKTKSANAATPRDGAKIPAEMLAAKGSESDEHPVRTGPDSSSSQYLVKDDEWFRLLVETMNDGLGVIDERTFIVYCNAKLLDMLGFEEGEVLGRPIADFLDEKNLRIAMAQLAKRRKGEDGSYEMELTRKDSERVRVIVSPQAIFDEAGQFKGALAVFSDCSDRDRLARALEEDEDRFRALCEASIEGIAIHDKGEILDANPAFAAMYGYDSSEVIGMHALEFAAPESHEVVWESVRTEIEKPYEAVGIRKDGTQFPVEICGKTITYRGRKARVAAIRDLTQRRRITRELQSTPGDQLRARLTRIANARKDQSRKASRAGIPQRKNSHAGVASLSSRELEVVWLLAEGFTNGAIAERLEVSTRTVDHHVSHILTKLDAKNRTEAVLAAARGGALSQDLDG